MSWMVAFVLYLALAASADGDDSPKRISSKPVPMEFVLIPAGSFRMGARWPADGFERLAGRKTHALDGFPPHEVELDAFYLGTTEVTIAQWKVFVHDAKYKTTAERAGAEHFWARPEFKQSDVHPVTYVSYEDAVAFAKWLSAKDGASYRLPTEAEWEYACRGGAATELPWGEPSSGATRFANLQGKDDGWEFTAPVGKFEPNAWDLHDMIGNLWEWCSDWVADDYYTHSPPANPTGPSRGTARAYRGGSWCDPLSNALPSLRNRQPPERFYGNSGFRLVRELPQTHEAWLVRARQRWEWCIGRALTTVGRLNMEVEVDGIRWRVTGATDLGNQLQGSRFQPSKTTSGRFIRVDMEIENLHKEPATFFSRELFDDRGRQYDTLSDAVLYFDEKTIVILENVNPNVPLKFAQIYEVAADAGGFGILVSNLKFLNRQEAIIELGF